MHINIKKTEKNLVREADKIASMKEEFDAMSWSRVEEIASELTKSDLTDEERQELAHEMAAIAETNKALMARLGFEKETVNPLMGSGVEVPEDLIGTPKVAPTTMSQYADASIKAAGVDISEQPASAGQPAQPAPVPAAVPLEMAGPAPHQLDSLPEWAVDNAHTEDIAEFFNSSTEERDRMAAGVAIPRGENLKTGAADTAFGSLAFGADKAGEKKESTASAEKESEAATEDDETAADEMLKPQSQMKTAREVKKAAKKAAKEAKRAEREAKKAEREAAKAKKAVEHDNAIFDTTVDVDPDTEFGGGDEQLKPIEAAKVAASVLEFQKQEQPAADESARTQDGMPQAISSPAAPKAPAVPKAPAAPKAPEAVAMESTKAPEAAKAEAVETEATADAETVEVAAAAPAEPKVEATAQPQTVEEEHKTRSFFPDENKTAPIESPTAKQLAEEITLTIPELAFPYTAVPHPPVRRMSNPGAISIDDIVRMKRAADATQAGQTMAERPQAQPATEVEKAPEPEMKYEVVSSPEISAETETPAEVEAPIEAEAPVEAEVLEGAEVPVEAGATEGAETPVETETPVEAEEPEALEPVAETAVKPETPAAKVLESVPEIAMEASPAVAAAPQPKTIAETVPEQQPASVAEQEMEPEAADESAADDYLKEAKHAAPAKKKGRHVNPSQQNISFKPRHAAAVKPLHASSTSVEDRDSGSSAVQVAAGEDAGADAASQPQHEASKTSGFSFLFGGKQGGNRKKKAHTKSEFARFQRIYESRDGGLALYEDANGHITAVDTSKLA